MGAQILKLGLPVLQQTLFKGGSGVTRGLVENNRGTFNTVLAQTLATTAGKDGKKIDLKSVGNDVLALLAAGMPLSMIVNQVSTTLANKVATALSSGAQNTIDNLAKNKLVQAFASAIAPPGGSPPGSNAEIAAALADRLQTIVANLAGEVEANAGQQSRFSGQVLDANSAKEIPAQQVNGQPAQFGAAVSSFVDSILRDVLAQLQPSALAANPAAPLLTPHDAPSPDPAGNAPLLTPRVSSQVQIGAALLTPHDSHVNLAGTAPLLTPHDQQPGSVLGRIIARAIISDAHVNGTQLASNANGALKTQPVQSQQAPAQADVRAALDNLVATLTGVSPKNSGGSQSNGGNAFGQFGQQAQLLSQLGLDKPLLTPAATTGDSFASQANALLGAWTLPNGGSQAVTGINAPLLTPYTSLDPNSIIDQVVKGFVVRNFGENNSEVRMRLSPEHLGDVSLKLSVVGGNISASITAANADVRQTLLDNQSQLSKSLADAGLKLANFSVNVSGGGPGNSSSQQHQLAQQAGVRRIGFHGIGKDEDMDGQSDVLAATPNFGPPLLVGQNKGLFNYLA